MRAPIAVLVAAALVLSACAAVPPAAPTQAEIDAYNDRMLDLTWQGSGLADVMQRPATPPGAVLDEAPWIEQTAQCLQNNGLGSVNWGMSNQSGYGLSGSSGLTLTNLSAQLVFYQCVSANQRIPANDLISAGQLDYTYDYYADWIVPCMWQHDIPVHDVPTREEFAASYGQWSPYWRLAQQVEGNGYNEAVDACGAERPAFG